MILTGDRRSFRDTNVSHCHFVNHTSYTEHSRMKIGRLANRPGTGCTKVWPKGKSMQPQIIRIKHQKGTALCRWAEHQLRFNAHILGSLFSFVIRTVRTAVTLLLRTPPPWLRHLSYRGTRFYIPCWQQSVSYAISHSVKNRFHLTSIFKFLVAKIHLGARSGLHEGRSAVLSTQNYGPYKLILWLSSGNLLTMKQFATRY